MKKAFFGLAFIALQATAQEKPANYKIENVQKLNSELYQLVYNPTNNSVYVAGPKKGFSKDADNFVYVLDAKDLSLKDSIAIGKYMPFGIALNNKTQTLYVGHSLQKAVSAIDIKSKKQTIIPNDKEKAKIREIVVDEVRNKVYVSDHGNPSIWEIDGKTNKLIKTIEQPGAYLLGLNVDAKRGKVYATDSQDMQGNVMVYNSESGKLESQFKTWSYCPLNIALDQVNNRIFVSQSNDNNVTVLDGNTGEIINKVYLGYDSSPIGLVYDAKNNLVYTANRNKQQVAVIDAKSYKVIETVATEGLPNTISLDPVSGAIYVTNKEAGKKGKPVANGNTVMKIVKNKI